jgi:murein DD-endopeptidase MepM/ murein hydrolase activator NlpD
MPINGGIHFAQRYAIDWLRLDDKGHFYHGDPSDVHNWAGYGLDVVAAADGTVIETLNTLEDQVPAKNPDPKTINLENIGGNHVIEDLGHGVYAFYAHLQKGSVTVAVGDHVRRGQLLGKVGTTGNSSAPHLHFHLMNGPSMLGSDGLPYLIDFFVLEGQLLDKHFEKPDSLEGDFSAGLFPAKSQRLLQLPLDLTVVNF